MARKYFFAVISPANAVAFAFGPFDSASEVREHCDAVPVSEPYTIATALPPGIDIVAPGDLSSLPHFGR